MEGDRIFVSINPYYSHLIKEKLSLLEMKKTNNQTCKLVAVKSNAKDENSKLAFGGNLSETKRTPEYRALMFGRTASAVFRMVMLEAVQIPENHWPKLGERTKTRNKNALYFTPSKDGKVRYPVFELLNPNNNTKKNARKYWRHYDQMFPHFLIEDEVLEHKGEKVLFENTMFILRESAPQVIEITTKANATMYPPLKLGWKEGEFDCKVEVSCICKTFDQNEDNDEIFNGLMAEVDAPRFERHERRRSVVLRSLGDIE